MLQLFTYFILIEVFTVKGVMFLFELLIVKNSIYYTIIIILSIVFLIVLVLFIIQLLQNKTAVENRYRLQSVLEAISDGIWELDILKNKINFNDQYWKTLGYKNGHVANNIKEGWLAFIHPGDKEKIRNEFNSFIIDKKTRFKLEYRMITKGKDVLWISTRGRIIIKNKTNEPVRAICINSNITKRKKAEENLIKSELFMNQVIDLIPQMINAKDEFGRFILANKATADYYGVTPKELIFSLHKDFHPDFIEFKSIEKTDKEVINTNKSVLIPEEKLTNSKGTIRYFQTLKIPFKEYTYDRPAVLQVSIDITEQKQIKESLKNSKEIAESANRAKSEFLANMSHEIRTPMNSILGFADLLSFQIKDDILKSYVNAIKNSGKNLLELINGILDLSKIEAGKFELQNEYIDTFSFLQEFKNMFEILAKEKGLEFILDINSNLPSSIFIDELRLKQVIVNLIGNAIKFTENGFVKLKAKTLSKNELVEPKIATIKISVEDTGIGITKDFQKKIFEAFQQQDGQSTRKYEGTGLGLALSKKLIELMKGEIQFRSFHGKGTEFTILLNEIAYNEENISSQKKQTFNINTIEFFNDSTVLIADDNENNRNYLKGILKYFNINAYEAINGKDAFDLALKIKPDIILTDIKMPGTDGFQLLDLIRNKPALKNIPVIANSASVLKEEKQKIEESQFNGFLMKPIQLEELIKLLVRFLPHKITTDEKTEVEQNSALIDDEVTTDKPENIKKALKHIESGLMEEWELFENQQPISEVEEFAHKLIKVGNNYNCSSLSQYGNSLLKTIESFDIDSMLRILKQFSKLVENYKLSLK